MKHVKASVVCASDTPEACQIFKNEKIARQVGLSFI